VNIPHARKTTQDDPAEQVARRDGYKLRRLAITHHVPLVTDLPLAQVLLKSLTEYEPDGLPVEAWQDFVGVQ
jgi:hypothetical protein